MKIWVYVEGASDKLGLEALWKSWRERLNMRGWGMEIIPLKDKGGYLKNFGARAAEKLVNDEQDLVVGLPDLHPVAPYLSTEFEHRDAESLKLLQKNRVLSALKNVYGFSGNRCSSFLNRLLPSVLRHDFEMLLLAAGDQLRSRLGTRDQLGKWRTPVEDQNLDKPPKRIVEQLFSTKSRQRRAYHDTVDAPAILKNVSDLRAMLRVKSGQWNCPEFVEVLKWIGTQTGVSACDLE